MSPANPEYDAEPSTSDRIREAVEETQSTVEQTKGKLKEFGTTATETINRNRDAAANGLEEVAGSLRDQADHLSIDRKVSDVAHTAAEKLNATAGYIRQNDFDSMVHDVKGLLRRNSGVLMLMALGLGFLLGRRVRGRLRA